MNAITEPFMRQLAEQGLEFAQDQLRFMPACKVRDKRGGDVFRVKARFCDLFLIDFITLQNVITRREHTVGYFDVLPYLELVCNPTSTTNEE